MLTQILINSVDVTTKVIDWEREGSKGDAIQQLEMKVIKSISDLLTITEGMNVEVWRGWSTTTDEKIFDGYIQKYEPDGGKITLTCCDKLWDLIRKEVTHTYDSEVDASAGVISEIFKDLVETYGGLTASVQSSGTVKVLEKFVCNHTDIFERCKKLAEALDWQFYYKASTDKVYFEPKGYNSNTGTFQVGSNIVGVPKWNYDITEMANDVIIVGAYQEIERTETGRIGTTTGYATDGVDIDFVPISVKVYGDSNNPPTTLLVGGLPDSTATFNYYVDKNQKKIYPKSGTTFTTDDYYEIRYSHAVPIPLHQYTQSSIDSYGQFKKTVTFTDIRSVADAETRGQEYLVKYSTPFVYSTLKVKAASTNSLDVGQMVNIVDTVSTPNVNKSLIVNRHRIRYPGDYEEIEVGDKFWRISEWNAKIEEKFKRLDENEFANEDIVTELISMDNMTLYPTEVEPRYRWLTTQAPDGTGMIWGNADYGTWGTDEWSADSFDAEVNSFIQQYENIYTETFIDEDFKGTTTATWGTGEVTFTSGQLVTSTAIDYHNGTITTATMTVTSSSGTFLLEMSANGGVNWKTATSGRALTFTNTGTDLRWRITEDDASTGTVTKVVIGGYH